MSCDTHEAFNNSGQVFFTASTGGAAVVIGAAVYRGRFRTESGISGTFTAIEFLVGLRGEIGVIAGFSKNLSSFVGGNDTVSEGIGLDDISRASDLDGNFVGASTTIGGRGINIGLTGGFSNTEVTIERCS